MQSLTPIFSTYISSDDIIVLAISGGVDSMVLLDLVLDSHNRANIIVAHLDHSLRGAESNGDRELVASICKRENIVFEVEKLDIASMAKNEKSSLEAIARRERYNFLESVRVKHNSRYILTAHHLVDQTETIIGNIVKGGKVRGLSGMSVISGYIFRPLLTFTKANILEYAHKKSIEYREDSTNKDTIYDRNRIRHDIIPVIESLNPNIHNTFKELALYMQSLGDFLTYTVEDWLHKNELESGKPNTFLSISFLSLSLFFQAEIISYLYVRAQGGSSQGLSRGLIDELIRFIGDPGSYGKKEIKKLKLERRGERILFIFY
ncbi:tRNA lysidine(34) synthetase TilS [Candidatus Gracilibacteria bacterium]|nr:tRNA lysidine(34) synthetase TilS [Candidatus Gracilibacteria bacterium]